MKIMKSKVTIVSLCILITSGCGRVEKERESTRSTDTNVVFALSLTNHPDTKFTTEARDRLAAVEEANAKRMEELALAAWKNAVTNDTLDSFNEIITQFPNTQYAEKARASVQQLKIEQDAFNRAITMNTQSVYRTFLDEHLSSRYASEAIQRLMTIANPADSEKKAYNYALDNNVAHLLTRFLDRFPQSVYAYDAKRRLNTFKSYTAEADTEMSYEMLKRLCNWNGKMNTYCLVRSIDYTLRQRIEEDLVKLHGNVPLVRSFFGAESVVYAAD